jgi:hypothetical protein
MRRLKHCDETIRPGAQLCQVEGRAASGVHGLEIARLERAGCGHELHQRAR